MSKVDVSIIIVNYNTPELTTDCIKSIYGNVQSSYEIIVVDNASADDSVNILSNRFPDIKLIESKINLGFGRANNLGAGHANGEYLFLLNSDTLLHNDPFPYFIEYCIQNNNIGAVGTYLHDAEKQYVQSGGHFYSIRKYLRLALNNWIRRETEEVRYSTEITEVDYVIGADLFINRDLFFNLGGFDPNIFMYFEDVELCRRIHSLGFSSYLIPGPDITHLVKASSTSQFARVHNTASLMYCLKKEYSYIEFKLFQLAYFFLKFPILIVQPDKLSKNIEYLMSIFKYKKYLFNQNL